MPAWLFSSLQGYRREWLRGDLLAGLAVWAVLVPESLAYASLAGVSPVVRSLFRFKLDTDCGRLSLQSQLARTISRTIWKLPDLCRASSQRSAPAGLTRRPPPTPSAPERRAADWNAYRVRSRTIAAREWPYGLPPHGSDPSRKTVFRNVFRTPRI
jgi:Sulfate permease family